MTARRVIVERGPAPNRFEWTEELVALLGKRPDDEVAELASVHRDTVAAERRRRGIAAFRPTRRIEWTPEAIAMLGTDSDHRIAARLGISHTSVFKKRHELGIPSYVPRPHDKSLEYPLPPEALALLGKESDYEIAKMFGVPHSTVFDKRRRLRIPPSRPAPRRIEWTEEKLALLGTAPDRQVAERIGASPTMVAKERLHRGIPPFQEGGSRVVPTPQLVELLDQPTTVVVRRTGLKADTVKRLRDELGITAKTFSELRWTPDVLARLGKEPDRVIAERIGVSPDRVGAVRRRLGIPPQRVQRPWQPEEIAQLGTAPDPVLAQRLGRSRSSLTNKRRSLGIPAYSPPRYYLRYPHRRSRL